MKTNTFRLFISSTFSDFNEERQILQAKVFPHLKEYCQSKGFNFQPIDLRWGVSNEAQLDQKALSLCIEEVQASKNTLHPNFLIMAGNRYGWVPLPYAIEQSEFESIRGHVADKELDIKYWKHKDDNGVECQPNNRTCTQLALLEQWYQLDENQLPASYILQERKDLSEGYESKDHLNYLIYENWGTEEKILTKIVQDAVSKTDLSGKDKDKYFTSATEQEVIEGIFNYSYETEYQKNVNGEDGNYKETDKSNVYAYLRNSSCDTELCIDKFEEEDNLKQKAIDFKDRLVESVLPDNIYQTNSQITSVSIDEHNNSLNYEYKEIVSDETTEFETSMIRLLKQSIDRHEKVVAKDFDIIQNQKDFKDVKLKGFIGREKDLEVISDYISGDNNQPLVIYGPSGMGKSALMAKAINKADGSFDGQVVYRFVGSTSKLTSSIEVVISILAEMGIPEELRMTTDETGQEKAEDIKDFSLRIYEHFVTYNNNIAIFIDAIDQVPNKDKLIWLPAKLPSNVKFIISSLQDKKYEKDSKFTDFLLNKSGNVHKLSPLDASTAKSMATSIMSLSGRTMSDKQSAHLFSQPDSLNPLYINIACQEMIHWKHIDGTKDFEAEGSGQDLAPTQTLIIQEYISNLNQLYHHNKDFIEVVISTVNILGSVSESDLLAIINADDKLIESVAPSTYHHNETNALPIAIWARLHSMLKPFLKTEEVDGEERMSFFHREFTTLYKEPDLKLRDNLLINLQKLIKQSDDNGIHFNDNNYAKHYIQALGMNFNKPKITDRQREYIQFFNELSTDYANDVQVASGNCGHSYLKAMDLYNAIYYLEISHLITESLYYQQPEVWARDYNGSVKLLLSGYLQINNLDASVVLSEKYVSETSILYRNKAPQYLEYHKEALHQMVVVHTLAMKDENTIEVILNDLISVSEKSLEITENLYKQQPEVWAEDYTSSLNNLAMSYKQVGRVDEAIGLFEKSLEITESLYKQQPEVWAEIYTTGLNALAMSYNKVDRVDEAIGLFEKSLEITDELSLLENNQFDIYEFFIHFQCSIISLKRDSSDKDYLHKEYLRDKDRLLGYTTYYVKRLEMLFSQQPEAWAKIYTSSLNNLAMSYKQVDRVDEAIGLFEKSLEITEGLYKQQPEVWVSNYIDILKQLQLLLSVGDMESAVTMGDRIMNVISEMTQHPATHLLQLLDLVAQQHWLYRELRRPRSVINEPILLSIKTLEKLYHKEPSPTNSRRLLDATTDYLAAFSDVFSPNDLIYIANIGLRCSEGLYSQQPEVWAEDYTSSLNNLAMSYNKVERVDDAIGLFEKSLEITEGLYSQQPEVWAEDYTTSLGNLTGSYKQVGRVDEAEGLMKMSLSVDDDTYSQIIQEINESRESGDYADLNEIDVSGSKNLYKIFAKNGFDGDISEWILHAELDVSETFSGSVYSGTVKQKNGVGINAYTIDKGVVLSLVTYTETYPENDWWVRVISEYVDGYKNGKTINYFRSGQKQSQGNYLNGKLDGLETCWYETSYDEYEDCLPEIKQAEVNFKNGKRHGSRTLWDTKGNITYTATFHRGESTDQNGLDPQYDDEDNITHYIEYKGGHIINPNVQISDFI